MVMRSGGAPGWAPLVAEGGGDDEVVPLSGPLLEDGRAVRGDVGRGQAPGAGPAGDKACGDRGDERGETEWTYATNLTTNKDSEGIWAG